MKHIKLVIAVASVLHVCSILNLQSQKAPKMPEFVWDNIQLYFHGRKATAFTNTEIAYLSQFPLITLEKTTGSQTYTTTEEGSVQAARLIKAMNPKAKVLYYRNVLVHYPSYAVNSTLGSIANPFLKDSSTGENISLVGNNPAYDLSKPAVRKWWVDHCKFMSDQPEIDGVFVDGNVKVLTPSYLQTQLGDTKKKQVLDGYKLMMDSLNAKLNPSKLNFANLIRATLDDSGLSYMNYFDGSYLENFDGNKDYIAKGIDAAQIVARQNKLLAFTFFINENLPAVLPVDDKGYVILSADNQKLFEFYLAIYLICAEQYSYFFVTENYDLNPGMNRFWLKKMAEYDKPLGVPLGPAIKNGYVYTRKFQYAEVSLDLNTMSGFISWKNTTNESSFNQNKLRIFSKNGKIIIVGFYIGEKIELFDTVGKKVFDKIVDSETTEINLPKGTYIISAYNKIIYNY